MHHSAKTPANFPNTDENDRSRSASVNCYPSSKMRVIIMRGTGRSAHPALPPGRWTAGQWWEHSGEVHRYIEMTNDSLNNTWNKNYFIFIISVTINFRSYPVQYFFSALNTLSKSGKKCWTFYIKKSKVTFIFR